MRAKSFLFIAAIALGLIQCEGPQQNAPAAIEKASPKDSCCTKDSIGKNNETSMQTEITCPHCGFKKTETMPTDVCMLKYNCKKCGAEV